MDTSNFRIPLLLQSFWNQVSVFKCVFQKPGPITGQEIERLQAQYQDVATEKVSEISQQLGAALYAANAAQATGGTTPADDGVQDAEVVDEQK
jgi:hypothetical protein